uniref:CCHC-type domain-containing protein n=2 Tax=Globodera rostochiensis TaxID=31243 RepID=A0A914H743_GLORO
MPRKSKKAKKDKPVVVPPNPEANPPSGQQQDELQYEDLSSDDESISKEAGGLATAHQDDQHMESLLSLSPENIGALPALSPTTVDRLLADDQLTSKSEGVEASEEALGPAVKKANEGEPQKEMGREGTEECEDETDKSKGDMPLGNQVKDKQGERKEEEEIGGKRNSKAFGLSVKNSGVETVGNGEEGEMECFENEGFGGEQVETAERPNEESSVESEEEDVPAADGRKMMVCQIEEKGTMLTSFGDQDKPGFVFLSQETLCSAKEESGDTGNRILKMGDLVWVQKWKEVDETNRNWISGAMRINAQAFATAISQVFLNGVENKIGIITELRNNAKEGNRLVSVDVAAPGFVVIQRLYPHQVSVPDANQLKSGRMVSIQTAQINRPPSIAVSPNGVYILPAHNEHAAQLKLLAHCPIIGTGMDKMINEYQFPFSSESDVALGEKGVAAALSACLLKVKAKQDEFAITTELHILEDSKESAVVATFEHYLNNKRKFVELVEVWEIDTAIQARVEGVRKHCAVGRVLETNKSLQGGMFLFQAKVLLVHQAAKKHDSRRDFGLLSEGHRAVLSPCESSRALEHRMALFSENKLSSMASVQSGTGKIWRALLSIENSGTPEMASSEEQHFAGHPALQRLQEGQKQSALLMLDNHPRVVAQQAPPGSGKTFTVAAIVAALLARPDAAIICVAPLNVAVVKICEELVSALRVEGLGVVPLALFSGNGKSKYREQLGKISDNLLEAAVTSEVFWKQLDGKKKKEVRKYQRLAKKRPRVAKEAKIAEYVLKWENKRVLCCTLGFAEQIGRLITNRNIVILDEAGQASFSQVCAMLSPLDQLKKLFITGDRYQLAVNMKEVPEELRVGYGLDTILLNVDASGGCDRTTLQVNYRSHPQIVACVEHAAYTPHGEVLRPGPGIFRMLLDHTKMPVPDSPLLLIHQESPMETEETSYSAANRGQTETVLELLRSWRAFPGSIRVISLYAGQAAQIGREIQASGLGRLALSATADSMQGHESDLVIVVTTVSRAQRSRVDDRKDRKNAFWGDPARVNVALSRGKHGLVVVGNLLDLASSDIWARFLSKAMEFTVVTHPAFIQTSAQPRSRYIRGVLAEEGGQSVQDFRFYAKWDSEPPRTSRSLSQPSKLSEQPVRQFFPPLPPPFRHSQNPGPATERTPSTEREGRPQDERFRRPDVHLETPPSRPPVRCWRCDRIGHVSSQCRDPNPTNRPRRQ